MGEHGENLWAFVTVIKLSTSTRVEYISNLIWVRIFCQERWLAKGIPLLDHI